MALVSEVVGTLPSRLAFLVPQRAVQLVNNLGGADQQGLLHAAGHRHIPQPGREKDTHLSILRRFVGRAAAYDADACSEMDDTIYSLCDLR